MSELTIAQHAHQAIQALQGQYGEVLDDVIADGVVVIREKIIQELFSHQLLLELMRLFYQDYITRLTELQNVHEKIHKYGNKASEKKLQEWYAAVRVCQENVIKVRNEWSWFGSLFQSLIESSDQRLGETLMHGHISVAQQIAVAEATLARNLAQYTT